MSVSLDVTKAERATIALIVTRAVAQHKLDTGKRLDALSLTMDLTACHANGMPLKLDRLLAADGFNFAHDVYGIMRHMDRESWQLTGCFVPRFADLPMRKAA